MEFLALREFNLRVGRARVFKNGAGREAGRADRGRFRGQFWGGLARAGVRRESRGDGRRLGGNVAGKKF